jgi:hypothetical protein
MSVLTASIESTRLTRWNFGLGALTLLGVFAIALALKSCLDFIRRGEGHRACVLFGVQNCSAPIHTSNRSGLTAMANE